MKRFLKQFFEKQLRYSPLFYKRLKAVQELEKASSSSVDAWREEKLLSLIRKAYRKSSFYKSLYDRHGIDVSKIRSTRDLYLCPIVTRQDVVEHHRSIFCGYPLTSRKTASSGTSGQSVTVYRDYASIVEEGAYQWAHRIRFGHYPGMKTVVIRGNLSAQERERYDPFTKTLYLSSFHLNRENADWYFQRISDFAPNAIFAYPSSVESLANLFIEKNQRLRVPLVFTSSETLYSYQREKVQQAFSSQIVDWYGNAERTIALKENVDNTYDQLPLYSINELQKNRVITTSLINFSFPLIRYEVDDVILLDDEDRSPAWQRKVQAIQGRSDDVLVLPDGTQVGLICNAFDGIDHIRMSQVVQKDRETIDVNLVVADAYSRNEEARLTRQLKESIGENTPFSLNYVVEDNIIKSDSGKFKLIVNHMHPDGESLSA